MQSAIGPTGTYQSVNTDYPDLPIFCSVESHAYPARSAAFQVSSKLEAKAMISKAVRSEKAPSTNIV
jgi:hypothetical protein